MKFVTQTTPEVRCVLGWPPPGDSYYTGVTLGRLADAYPGINLAPYIKSV